MKRDYMSGFAQSGVSTTEWTKTNRSSQITIALVALAILLGFFLRIRGVASLTLWGDSSYSVYTATQDLVSIATGRVYDGHPPLYYYLLHFWIALTGTGELSLRMLSIFFGVLTIPATYKLVQAHLQISPNDDISRRRYVGIVATYLVALSPTLIYYSRIVRMYSLIPLLTLLSAYMLLASLKKGQTRNWIVYGLVTLAALYTHYYVLAVVAAEAVYILAFHRKERRALVSWFTSQVIIGVLYLPWLAYAALTSATTTAGIISKAPPAEGLLGFLEEFWIPFNFGVTWGVNTARPLSLLLGILVIVGVVYLLRARAFDLRSEPIIWLMVAVPLVGSFVVFLVLPYAVRHRFLVFAIPFYLILLSWVIVLLGRLRVMQFVLAAAMVAMSLFAVVRGQATEQMFMEKDTVQMVDHIQALAQPGDAVVFHAAWQIGYLKSHYQGELPALYSLDSLPESNFSLLEKYPRVWLAMYWTAPRDPQYPLEAWLDTHWHKAEKIAYMPTRLNLYLAPNVPAVDKSDANFILEDGQPGIRLDLLGLDHRELAEGSPLALTLRWEALRPMSKQYTVLVHIVDKNARRWAGQDGEPQDGASPTSSWQPGQTVDDHRAIILPKNIPPGEYNVLVGMYNSDGQRLAVADASGKALGSAISIGSIRIRNADANRIGLRNRVDLGLTPELRLLGYEKDNDSYRLESRGLGLGKLDTPQDLFVDRQNYRPGEDIHLNIAWQTLMTPADHLQVLLRLVDDNGSVGTQKLYRPFDGTYDSQRWQPGEILADSFDFRVDGDIPDGKYALQVAMLPASAGTSPSTQDSNVRAVTISKIVVGRY